MGGVFLSDGVKSSEIHCPPILLIVGFSEVCFSPAAKKKHETLGLPMLKN